jgi:4-alpha-glucanotransferase
VECTHDTPPHLEWIDSLNQTLPKYFVKKVLQILRNIKKRRMNKDMGRRARLTENNIVNEGCRSTFKVAGGVHS